MGVQDVSHTSQGDEQRLYMQRVLADLHALERMLDEGLIESDRRRIGVEQELVLVDQNLMPAPIAQEVLARIDDPRVTTEVARFNIEFNCDPMDFTGSCLSAMRTQIEHLLGVVREAAEACGARPMLTGICPTLELAHLSRDNITPKPRYFALDEALRALRGSDYHLRIKGADELTVTHPTVLLEALNTSFQVHYQVTPDEFARAYNLAQLVAAPVLAACVNAPILFGKRLWRETRIAIFQQVVDTRAEAPSERDLSARVRFGESWIDRSVLEIFRNDVARFKMILASKSDEDPFAMLDAQGTPRLSALQSFNSTVYRWMRPCYGVTDGRPHLRIENRILPAGPTIADEMAGAALWLGLMHAGIDELGDPRERLDFADARANFTTAAREGLTSHFAWLDGQTISASDLLVDRLIPLARAGLAQAGIDQGDIDASMDLIEQRVRAGQTGACWQLRSVAQMRGRGTRAERLHALADGIMTNQAAGLPVHEWALAQLGDGADDWQRHYATIGQYMSTDLYTVDEEQSVDLVASIMDWENIRHVPVEDRDHRLVGLVSYRKLIRLLSTRKASELDTPIPVSQIMITDPVTASPETTTLEAIRLMCDRRVSCLPVVRDGRLVGIISERDFIGVARLLVERALGDGAKGCL